jgi:hypothetical protein
MLYIYRALRLYVSSNLKLCNHKKLIHKGYEKHEPLRNLFYIYTDIAAYTHIYFLWA